MNGIFTYSTRFRDRFQQYISLNEGGTPLVSSPLLANHYGIAAIYFKDETKNPTGSFKDRATAYQLTYWREMGHKQFVLSSSGNAAISAAAYCNKAGLQLDIFVSPVIPQLKKERLEAAAQSEKIAIHYVHRPKHDAFQFAKVNDAINLVQSKDDSAIEGYKTLGFELTEEMKEPINGIFMPTSSGTGLIGIGEGTDFSIPLYAIQTTKVYPIARHFDTEFIPTETSLSSAISAYATTRERNVVAKITATGGSSYAIRDEEIETALKDMKIYTNMDISYDSALSIAGLIRALQEGKAINRAICILTGK